MMQVYVFKKKWKRTLAHIFDAIGIFITFFLSRKFPIKSQSLKKILVTRIDHLGDALLLRPALQQLRLNLPDAQIHLLTTSDNAPIFLLDKNIDMVIPFSGHWFQKQGSATSFIRSFLEILTLIRSQKYDIAIDFRGDLRTNLLFFLAGIPIRYGYGMTGGGWMLTHEKDYDSNKHQVLLNLCMLNDFGVKDSETQNSSVRYPQSTPFQLLHQLGQFGRPYAVIHPGAGNPLKEWPRDHFIELIRLLLLQQIVKTIFLVGSESERHKSLFPALDNVKDLRGGTDLHELAFLLERAAFFFGNDSGPAHLAAAQGAPVVVVTSPTNTIEYWHPWTKRLRILSANSGEISSVEQAKNAVIDLLAQNTQLS